MEKRDREKKEREGAAGRRKRGSGKLSRRQRITETRRERAGERSGNWSFVQPGRVSSSPCRVTSKNTERFIFIECARAMIQFRPIERRNVGRDRHGYESRRVYKVDVRVPSAPRLSSATWVLAGYFGHRSRKEKERERIFIGWCKLKISVEIGVKINVLVLHIQISGYDTHMFVLNQNLHTEAINSHTWLGYLI